MKQATSRLIAPNSRSIYQNRTSSLSARLFVVTVAASCSILFFSACGKRRPPLPPVERVQQRTELLSGVQRGNQVILSWPAPLRNAADSSVQSIRRIDVYRLAQRPDAPLPLTEEDFSAKSTLIGSVTYDQIKNAADTLSYVDTLELAGEPARLRYAISYVNAAGQRAAFSNFLLIEPAARIAQAPSLVATDKENTEEGVVLAWQPPPANIDGSTPVNLLGYNVYRVDEAQTDAGQTPLNGSLVSGTQYVDKSAKFGGTYRYVVRSVSLGTEGAQVESLNSNSLTISRADTFPPSAPTALSIVAAIGRISIFFGTNPEADIAGYNIYRSTDPDLPKDKWTKLNTELLTRTSYQDERVETGKRYYYYVTAVDQAGSVSPPSEVVSELGI